MALTLPFSAANTPIWQATLESTSTVVLAAAKGTLRSWVSCAHRSGWIERDMKYIANSAAKNISSLESHTMVPTETMFGRFTWA